MSDPIETFLAWVGGAPKKSLALSKDTPVKPREVKTDTASWYSTMPDGRVVFYPYGTVFAKSGYVIASADFKRLRAQLKLWGGLSTVLTLAVVRWRGYPMGVAVFTVFAGFYWIWMRFVLRGLQRSSFGGPIRPRR